MSLNLEPLEGELKEDVEAQVIATKVSQPEEFFYPENRVLARWASWKKSALKGLLLLVFSLFYLSLLYGYMQFREESLRQEWQVLIESMPK